MQAPTRRIRLTRLDVTVIVFSCALGLILLGLLRLDSADTARLSGWMLYLAPADARVSNIWAANPADPAETKQLTFSTVGIQSFAVSPDARWIVYSEHTDAIRDTRLILLNLVTGRTQPLTACVDSSCENPVFSPDARQVAYERITLNSDLSGVPASPPRIWLVDLYSPGLAEKPLETDTQKLGMMPRWSPDGRYLAVLDRSQGGIRLYDAAQGTSAFIAESYESTGTFSPDGTRLVFPALLEPDDAAQLTLQQYQLADQTLSSLQTDVVDFRPVAVTFSPDGNYLAALHLSETANCPSGPALYLARVTTTDTLETITADDYCVFQLAWDATGDNLLVQRSSTDTSGNSQVEIWLYSPPNQTMQRLISNGFHPRWLR
jgi:Tol biopolymer transport system component